MSQEKHRPRLGLTALVAMLCTLGLAGCPSPGGKEDCFPGFVGCRCTSSGGCDPGATCSSGMCVKPGTVGGGEEIAPLPARSFLFLRDEGARGTGRVFHLLAYDTTSSEARLVMVLGDEDDGANGITEPNLALSPDRRWVALTAHGLRPSAEVLERKISASQLWVASVDGKTLRQVASVPIAETGLPNYRSDVYRPRWTGDGQEIFVRNCSLYQDAYLNQLFKCWARVAPAAGGKFRTYEFDGDRLTCSVTASPAPSGGTVAVTLSFCNRGPDSGIYEWTLEPPARRRKLVNAGSVPEPPIWRADGSAFVYVARGEFTDSQSRVYDTFALWQWTLATNQETLVFGPASASVKVAEAAVSPDGGSVVISLDSGDQGIDLYLREETGGRFRRITEGGRSRSPVW